MTREATAKVFQYIVHDGDLAGQVADDDFTSFADEDLTGAEQALLQAAAMELDAEVAGFGFIVEVTKVPAPPAPFAPIPYPNTSGGSAFDGLGPGVRSVFGHIGFNRG